MGESSESGSCFSGLRRRPDGPENRRRTQRNGAVAAEPQQHGSSHPPGRTSAGSEDFNVDRILRALSKCRLRSGGSSEGKTINGVNFRRPDGFPLPVQSCERCARRPDFLVTVRHRRPRRRGRKGAAGRSRPRTLNNVQAGRTECDSATLEWYLSLTDMRGPRYYQEPAERDANTGYETPIPESFGRVRPVHRGGTQGKWAAAFRPPRRIESKDRTDQIKARLREIGVLSAADEAARGATTEILVDAPTASKIPAPRTSATAVPRALSANRCASCRISSPRLPHDVLQPPSFYSPRAATDGAPGVSPGAMVGKVLKPRGRTDCVESLRPLPDSNLLGPVNPGWAPGLHCYRPLRGC